ncbi:MAG TPA: amidase family protein, partial [Ilumatobacteraceae bacterium]
MSESTIVAIAAAVRAAETSAASVTAGALERISERNPALNAFIAVDEELALQAAAAIDAAIERGDIVGPLAGVPLAVKDTEDTIGYITTYGSRLWAQGPVATRDSVLVARLKAAGCVVIGKTNTPELAAKGETDNLVFGATG